MAEKRQRKSALHNFLNTEGDVVKMATLAAALGVGVGTVRNRLRAWSKKNHAIPDDLHQFLMDTFD